MRSADHGRRAATIGGLVAIGLWSGTVALARSTAEALGPLTAAASVCSVSGAAAAISLAASRDRRTRISGLPRRYVIGCGALFVAYMALLFLAVGGAATRQQALEAGLLNYLWPALTLCLSVTVLGHRARWTLVPGPVLALAGVAVVVAGPGGLSWPLFVAHLSAQPWPYALAVAAAVSWALYSTLTRRWAGGLDTGATALFLPAAAVALLLAAFVADEPRVWTARAAMEVTALGLATFLAYSGWDHAMRRGDIVLVAAASYLTPLLSTALTCLYLAVNPGLGLWLGCGALVAGSLLSWWSVDAAPPPPPCAR